MVDVLWVWFARRMRGRVGVVGLAVLLALVMALAGPAAGAWGRSSSRAAALSAAISKKLRQESLPGAIVGVWQRGAAPYVRAFGVRNTTTGQPMTTNLWMRIAA
jgi:D-alanyl-D-alanine carboxypeptidase